MKYDTKNENESDTNENERQNTVPRRAYLKGLGTAALASGFSLAGTSAVAAAEPSSEEIGYGEGGYGEFGYGGVNGSWDDVVELTIIVEDANGVAIEGAEVIVHDKPVRASRTDGTGRMVVTLEEGVYNVEASKNGYYTEAVMSIGTDTANSKSYCLTLEE